MKTAYTEYIQIGIKRENNNILISCICRSPSSTNDEVIDELKHLLMTRNLDNVKYDIILHMGDFNFNDIDWSTQSTNAKPETLTAKFLDIVQEPFLYQHVMSPTRQ